MSTIGEHALVIGAGMGGLLAATALADQFERVTVIERDELPSEVTPRRAIPQGRHAHALLARGQSCLEQLLPGISGELLDAGAQPYRALREMRFTLGGHQLARGDVGRDSIVASRPLIEAQVRRRLRALENVELIDRCDAAGLVADAGRDRVTGLRILRRASGSAEECVDADLTVVATGRGGRLGAWLEALDVPRPAEERIDVDFAYASCHLALEPGALGGDRLVLIGARPGIPRTLALFAQERGRWLLTLGGYAGHHPPRDRAGFLAFAASVAPGDVADAIAAAVALDDIVRFRFPVNVRRRYTRLPGRLVPIGDAICASNPIYGHGMTVAALEAVALRDSLREGLAGCERRYLARADRVVDQAWQFAAGADLAQPLVPGPRSARVRIFNAYLRRLFAAAAGDPELATAFLRVSGMLEPPQALLRPAVARRVLRPRVRGASPAGEDRGAGVTRRVLDVDGVSTRLLEAGPRHEREAVVFVHGNPGSSADWEPLLRAVVGRHRAVAWDAPGFGRADTPAGFPQTVEGHAAFIARALDELGIDRAHLVLHDFGGPWALRWAAEHPARLASAVLLNTGALPGYCWHVLARVWRTPVVGELFMATTTRPGFRLLLRRGQRRPLPRPFVDRMYDDFDRATRRAVLELYRSVRDVAAGGRELARALMPLDRPALVLWGRHDPYIGVACRPRARGLPACGRPHTRGRRPLAVRRPARRGRRRARRLPGRARRRLSERNRASEARRRGRARLTRRVSDRARAPLTRPTVWRTRPRPAPARRGGTPRRAAAAPPPGARAARRAPRRRGSDRSGRRWCVPGTAARASGSPPARTGRGRRAGSRAGSRPPPRPRSAAARPRPSGSR
jgi:pimeloyl-ACP methyl ester carboxylesterase/2-polyprenyl-6-methoxyphenol hydroxylase-like FAD-dependent oxidoreductase